MDEEKTKANKPLQSLYSRFLSICRASKGKTIEFVASKRLFIKAATSKAFCLLTLP